MGVLFMGLTTLEAVVVAIAEASHHMFLILLFLIVMSKCINDVNDNEYYDSGMMIMMVMMMVMMMIKMMIKMMMIKMLRE
jgi:hypothetical protein